MLYKYIKKHIFIHLHCDMVFGARVIMDLRSTAHGFDFWLYCSI